MNIEQVAQSIGAKLLTPVPGHVEVERVYAGDRISDLLNQADGRAMLVSNLVGLQLVRVAELMDVPAICLVNDAEPGPQVLAAARGHGTVLLVSPVGMFETCGRLYQCLCEGHPDRKRVGV